MVRFVANRIDVFELFKNKATFLSGQYHCPVTFKVFNENSHIVAVKTTGNVFAFEVCTYTVTF